MIIDEVQIGDIFVQYCQALFTASPLENMEDVLVRVQYSVTNEMNVKLLRVFTVFEMELVMKHMAPLKALGPDGMLTIFYQSYWHAVGLDVSHVVLFCPNLGKILSSINHMFVTHIPKVKNP